MLPDDAITLSVLGPMRLAPRDGSTLPTATKPRQVLALLALRRGSRIALSTIGAELWESAPANGDAVVHTYVRTIRRALWQDEVERRKIALASHYGSYRLDPAHVVTDVDRWTAGLLAASRAQRAGDLDGAASGFRRSLALWEGDRPLMDLQHGAELDLEARHLERHRRWAQQRLFGLDLALGRYRTVLPDLIAANARDPLDEAIAELLVLALHRAGSVERALHAYREFRREVVRELGVEPGHRIQSLHQKILETPDDADIDHEPPLDAAGPPWTRAA